MKIEHLSLTNFRNYARLESTLPDVPIVVHGENAQGKTSLLESIYYLATSKSPYTTSDRQLLNWMIEDDPMPFARIAAEVNSRVHGMNRIEITIMLEQIADGTKRLRKTVRKNGANQRVTDIVGLMAVVLFLPQDLTLVEGSPSDRRRFMNVTLSQVERDYVAALDAYDKAVPQRNALLRRISEKQANVAELAYWDEQLITHGSKIIAARQRLLRELEIEAQRNHYDLTGRTEKLTINYQPSFTPTFEGDGQLSFDVLGLDLNRDMDADKIAPQFADCLKDELRESIHRGVTLSGPHRDEVRLLINDRDAGLYGSRGQARTAVMALKFAELTWMKERIGEYPILLLDEVVAELDNKRRAYLLERIDGMAQTLVTTTELDIFTDDFLKRAARWQVQNGQLSEITQGIS